MLTPGSRMISPMSLGVGSMNTVLSNCGDLPPNGVIQKRGKDLPFCFELEAMVDDLLL